MTGKPVVTITTVRPRPRPWGRLRGTWAVVVLLLSALDHLVAAFAGWRPIAWTIRRFAAPIAAAWRSGRDRPVPSQPATSLVYVTSPASERTHDDGSTSR